MTDKLEIIAHPDVPPGLVAAIERMAPNVLVKFSKFLPDVAIYMIRVPTVIPIGADYPWDWQKESETL